MYRVRYHLSKGEHFMHWQVTHPDGSVTYHDPETHCLLMRGCRLTNQRTVANRIHDGANKTPCAWVKCESIEITEHSRGACGPIHGDLPTEVKFNPRVMPHWHDVNGTNLDGSRFDAIVSLDRQLVSAFANLL